MTYLLLDVPHCHAGPGGGLDPQVLGWYFTRLIKSAVLNDAIISEADGWKAGAVLIPPGRSISGIWTLISSGMMAVLFRMAFWGCLVGFQYNAPVYIKLIAPRGSSTMQQCKFTQRPKRYSAETRVIIISWLLELKPTTKEKVWQKYRKTPRFLPNDG